MSYEIVTTLLLLLLALLLGAFFGCLFRRWIRPAPAESNSGLPKKAEGVAAITPDPAASAKSDLPISSTAGMAQAIGDSASSQDATAPVALSSPRGGNPDDLQRINGVGKKLELKLNDLGVYHYDQIADWDSGNVAYVDEHLNFKGRIDREEWIPQAKDLTQGKETPFSKTYDKKHNDKPTARKPKKSTPKDKPSRTTAQKPAAKKPVPARGLKAAIGGKADDLKTISGVGPKLEKTLHGLGIFHFEQVANWKAKDVSEVDDLLSFKGRIERDNWIAQAKKLMKGYEEG